MFKKGDIIMYPKYGASKINRVYKEETNGENYYELIFKDSLIISIPVDKAEKFGMRLPLAKKELQKALKSEMKESVKEEIKEIDFNALSNITKEKFATGKVEDVIELIQIIQGVAEKKLEKNKKLELTDRDNLRDAIDFLKSEVEAVLGEKAAEKIDIL